MSIEIRQLLREARFALQRFEEDDDLEALHDAQSMLADIDAMIAGDPEPNAN